MKFNLSRFGKPEKNRSGRKEKTGSPSRAEEQLRDHDKRKKEDKRKSETKPEEYEDKWEIERARLVRWGEGVYNSMDEGEEQKRKEVEKAIKELHEVQGFDSAAIQVKRIIEEFEKVWRFNDDKIHRVVGKVEWVLTGMKKKQERENEREKERFLLENKRERFAALAGDIRENMGEDKAKEERDEVEEAIKKLDEVKGFDGDTIQNVLDEVAPMLTRERFTVLARRIYENIDEDKVKEREEIEEVIKKLDEVKNSDANKFYHVLGEATSVFSKYREYHEENRERAATGLQLQSVEHERERLVERGRAIYDSIDGDKVREQEGEEVVRIIKELEKVQGFDGDTIQNVLDEVTPVLKEFENKYGKDAAPSWFEEESGNDGPDEENRKQEAERSVRNDLRQIKLMLIREKSDPSENFRESLSEVEAVMKSGDVDGARKQINLLQETDEYRALLSRHKERSAQIEQDFFRYEKELPESLHEEAREERDRLLESQGKLPMSKEDFDRYFSSEDFEVSADLKQQNVGDCYLIAAIHAMSRSPNFELFCRSSMERLHDGSWRVKIPLLSEDGEWITITKEEISPQKSREFLSWRMGKLDTRRKLRPVEGKEGLRVLEAAYIKKRFSVVDRSAAEGGWATEALMLFGGDNFVRFELTSDFPLTLKNLDSKRANSLDSFLENFDSETHMATVGTGDVGDFSYKVPGTGEPLAPWHAYSIAGVNAEERTITIANPWDTLRPMEMSFDQLKENFFQFGAVRIDNANLLLNMRAVDQETG